MTVRPPEDSPGSLSAIGNDEALRMEGFFAACGLPDILERSPRGERPHGSKTSSLPDRGPGQTLLKVRNGIRLPWRSIPETEHHGPHVRQDGLPLPPARNRYETGRLPGSSHASSRVVRFPAPPTRPSLPVALNTALCTDSVPPCGVPCRQPNQSVCPTGSASSSQEGPSHTFRAIPAAGSKREKKTPSLFTPSIPLLSGRMTCLISNSRQTATGTFAPT